MYPEDYSVFLRKRNATYEGDPAGDYVMAEDVNELQEAIETIERHLGLSQSDQSLEERIRVIDNLSPLRVDDYMKFSIPPASIDGMDSAIGNLSMYGNIIAPQDNENDVLALRLKGNQTNLYERISVGTKTLAQVQIEIGNIQLNKSKGVFLEDFSYTQVPRDRQQQIIDSVLENNLDVILTLTPIEILDNGYDATRNPVAKALELDNRVKVWKEGFGKSEGVAVIPSQVLVEMQQYLSLRRTMDVQLIGSYEGTAEREYSYAQALGLIFALDGISFGTRIGHTNFLPAYGWVPYYSAWKTTDPVIEFIDGGLKRSVKGGAVIADGVQLTSHIIGIGITSDMITFVTNSLDANILKDNSIGKEKIKDYDGGKVVDAINGQTAKKIKWSSIEDMDGNMLPGNIPSANMRQNVVLAINEKHNSTNQLTIVGDAIQSLDGAKLTGNIGINPLVQNVVKAINEATDTIDVASAQVDTLGSFDITTSTINAQSAIITEANIVDLGTERITSTDRINAKDIYAQYIKTIQLDADILKVNDLLVDDLISNKIKAQTLDAVLAHIGTAEIDNLIAGSITAEVVKAGLITAMNSVTMNATITGAMIKEASITSAQIISLDAVKINAGSISTGKVTIDSPDGHLKIKDENIKIYDAIDGNGDRRLRVILGNTSEIVPGTYGLVVLGADGTTRLYDNTGVYNAGIHNNAISNTKLQDDSVDGRVIIADSIIAEHITASAITGDKIKANEINAIHIQAGTITAGSAIIAEAAIGSAQIYELHGTKIVAGTITGEQIKAGSITANNLAIGFEANQVKYGYDNFEIFETGESPVDVFTPQTTAIVSKDIRRVGDKSLKVTGNNQEHIVYLQQRDGNFMNGLIDGYTYFVTAYAYTTDTTGVEVKLGLTHANGTLWGASTTITQMDGFKRIVAEITIPAGTISGTVALYTKKANSLVYFDCVMLEEKKEGITEPSMWQSASITTITGDMISTGTINASKGITFAAGAVTIDADGIHLQKLGGGSVTLSDDGLVIKGGAITIEGGLSADDLNPALTSRWDSASESIADLIDNNVITPYEKFGLEKEWERIKSTYDNIFSQALTYNLTGDLDITEYSDAVEQFRLYIYVTKDLNNDKAILASDNKTTNSEINGADYAIIAKRVYDASVNAQDRIARAVKSEIDETKKDLEDLDISPTYRVDIASSKGILFKNGNIQTVLRAIVYRGSINITDELDASYFTWKRISDDAAGDTVWNQSHGIGVKSITITHVDVYQKAQFTCDLDIPDNQTL